MEREEFNALLAGHNYCNRKAWKWMCALRDSRKWDGAQREFAREALRDGCGYAMLRFLKTTPGERNLIALTPTRTTSDPWLRPPKYTLHELSEMVKRTNGDLPPEAFEAGIRQQTYTSDEWGLSPNLAEIHTCAACGSLGASAGTALEVCGRCRKAHYCSKPCQQAHWPLHKKECVRVVGKSQSALGIQETKETAL